MSERYPQRDGKPHPLLEEDCTVKWADGDVALVGAWHVDGYRTYHKVPTSALEG